MRFKLLKSNSLRDVCASSNYTTGELAGHAFNNPRQPGLYGYGHCPKSTLAKRFPPCILRAHFVQTQKCNEQNSKTRRDFPMKTLLRTTIIGLLVCAGYAAVATDINVPHNGATMPQPCGTSGRPGGSGLCLTK